MSADTPQLKCRDLVAKASEYLDGELTAPERRRFEMHQQECPGCRGAVTSLQRTVEGIRRLSREPGSTFSRDLLSKALGRLTDKRT